MRYRKCILHFSPSLGQERECNWIDEEQRMFCAQSLYIVARCMAASDRTGEYN
jgi:hypothetical protein